MSSLRARKEDDFEQGRIELVDEGDVHIYCFSAVGMLR